MAKKSTAIVAKPEPEAAPSASSEVVTETAMERPDPTLLGVSVPLTLTFAALKQVSDAWRECLRELSIVVKSKGVKAMSTPEVLTEAPVVEA